MAFLENHPLEHILEFVCEYQHVGSFVTVTGGLVREAAHRTKASQSSFRSLR